MGYIILVVFMVYTFICIMNQKSVVIPILFFSLISPNVAIGNSMKIDSIYFFILWLFILCFIFNRKILLTKEVYRYTFFMLILGTLYLSSWLFFSRTNLVGAIISMVGMFKIPLLLIFISSLEKSKPIPRDKDEILLVLIRLMTIVNFMAILFQMFWPITAYNFFSSIYSSNSSTYYLQDINVWGSGGFYKNRYTRYFGVFETPMLMAFFVTIALTILIIYNYQRKKHKIFDYVCIVILIYSGLVSLTKTFYMGAVVITILLGLFSFLNIKNADKKTNVKTFATLIIIIFIYLGLFVFYNSIYSWIATINGSMARYFSFIINPLAAFTTRFGDNNTEGLLNDTITVINNNLILGVGFTSVSGEAIADSSYVVMLHHGGIVGFMLSLFYYIKMFIKKARLHDFLGIILLLLMFIQGIGLNILIGANITLFIYYYLLTDNRKKTNAITTK